MARRGWAGLRESDATPRAAVTHPRVHPPCCTPPLPPPARPAPPRADNPNLGPPWAAPQQSQPRPVPALRIEFMDPAPPLPRHAGRRHVLRDAATLFGLPASEPSAGLGRRVNFRRGPAAHRMAEPAHHAEQARPLPACSSVSVRSRSRTGPETAKQPPPSGTSRLVHWKASQGAPPLPRRPGAQPVG